MNSIRYIIVLTGTKSPATSPIVEQFIFGSRRAKKSHVTAIKLLVNPAGQRPVRQATNLSQIQMSC